MPAQNQIDQRPLITPLTFQHLPCLPAFVPLRTYRLVASSVLNNLAWGSLLTLNNHEGTSSQTGCGGG